MIRLAAFEGTQLYGDSLPLDANRGTGFDKIGFTVRQPVGVVVAITPFNYPALLVMHKLAPALAAGNAVVLKPARTTPLTALAMAACFVDAGLPEGVLSVLTGAGRRAGRRAGQRPAGRQDLLHRLDRHRERITQLAGVKKLSLELGASCPVVVLPDADLEAAAAAVAIGGFVNAGQVCISVQRVITHPVDRDGLPRRTGRRGREDPDRRPEVHRDGNGHADLRQRGRAGRALHPGCGRSRRAAAHRWRARRRGHVARPWSPTSTRPRPFSQDELFGPAVAVSVADDWQSAIAQANGTAYGLGAGVFTSDVAGAVRAIREIDAGVIHINWTPLWRADLMPYGGLKGSGIGKEGPRSAVAEMTDEKTVDPARPALVVPPPIRFGQSEIESHHECSPHGPPHCRAGRHHLPVPPVLRRRRRTPPAGPGNARHLRPRQRRRPRPGARPARRGDAVHPGPQRAGAGPRGDRVRQAQPPPRHPRRHRVHRTRRDEHGHRRRRWPP